MLGAIFGDIIGSVYEWAATKEYDFDLLCSLSRPTDDSVMTLAVAKALVESYGKGDEEIRKSLINNMKKLGRKYPDAGYGGSFRKWIAAVNPMPYNSFGNGSAMRVSPAGWIGATLDETLHLAELTAEVSHNHPEGIKGAQAVAAAIFLARTNTPKEEIISYIAENFGYDLDRKLDDIRPGYHFEVSCQKSVPESILAFKESTDYEDAVRKAVSMGGDSDTMGCIAGGIAEAYYGMPDQLREEAFRRLDAYMTAIYREFENFCGAYTARYDELAEK